MAAQAFALFDSPIGSCGIAWNAKGIAGFHLPLATAQATRSRLQQRWAGAVESTPPAGVQRVIDRVLALLAGEAIDLSDIPVDLADAPEFHRKVYEVARTIPPGRTMTYGEIAKRLGVPHELREVGQALGRNPIAIIVPCHRVLGADGKMGGFSASGGVATKRRILRDRGRRRAFGGPVVRAAMTGFGFDPKSAVAHLRKADPALAEVIGAVGPFAMQLKASRSLFGALAEAIVYQQLSNKAAATIYGRIEALYPRARLGFTPAHIRRTADDKLRGVGLSRAKVLALRDLAEKVATRRLPTLDEAHRLDDAAADRTPDRGARHRPLERRDVPDVPAGPARRAAGRRLQPAQGLCDSVSQAHAALARGAGQGRREVAALPHGGELVSVADLEQVKPRSRMPLE